MKPTNFHFKEPHYHIQSCANTMESSLRNSTYVLKNSSSHKLNNSVNASYITKTIFIRKDMYPITTNHIKYMNVAPWQKYASLKPTHCRFYCIRIKWITI